MTKPRRAACVIGYPARHSRSPKLHGYWIERYGIDAEYRAEEIPPDEAAEFIANLAAHGYVGANVTMPHKDIAYELSEPDDCATAVGASNTLWLDNGVLRSTNTDVEGFVWALDAASPGWDKRTKEAIVLGAGGAARAVVYALAGRDIETIHVINRTKAKAEAIRDRFGERIKLATWDCLPELMPRAGLLTNATSLGMHGQPELRLDLAPLPADAVVSDIVYVPLVTQLLADARSRGLATTNGLDMLLHQAVRGFELWFGKRPEVTKELYDLLAADIEAG